MTVTTARLPKGWGSARLFLLRRICRIYPAYLIITAVIFLVYLWRPDLINSNQDTPPNLVASFLLLPQRGLPLLLVGWTLVYEMFFYLIFAACLLASRRLFLPLLAAWGVLTLVLHQLVSPDANPYLQLAGDLQNIEFLLGVAVAVLVMARRSIPAAVLLATGVALFVVVCVVTDRSGHLPTGWFRLLGAGGACALILFGIVTSELQRGWRTPQPLVALGDASYSLYLVHVPILKVTAIVAVAVLPTGLPFHLLAVLGALVASVAGAWIYYRVVERPLQSMFKRRLTPAGRASTAAVP